MIEHDAAGHEAAVEPEDVLTSSDYTVFVFVALLALIALPFTQYQDWTPRMLVVLAALPLGVVSLVRLARARDGAACAGLAFSGWAFVSAAFSDSRWMTMIWSFGRDTSALIVAAGFGLWAIGRSLSDAGRRVLPAVVLVCLAVSALMGLVQIVVQRSGGGLLGLVGGRAHGLAGGHIYFGATMAGAACLAALVLRRRSWQWFGAIAAFAAVSNWSGSRFPVVVGLLAGIAVFVLRRDFRSTAAWCGTYLAGVIASSIVLSSLSGVESATDRAGSEASAGRMDAWLYGWQAFLERPLVGWGPFGFRPAVQHRFSSDFTALHAARETTQIWWDAHNLVVTIAVSYGIVGCVLAAWFAVHAFRSARGPLAVFVAVVAATWLLEPAGLATFPLTMLCLGAAMSASGKRDTPAGQGAIGAKSTRVLLLCGGLVAAMCLLTDVRIKAGNWRQDPGAVASAAAWAPWDPVAANEAAAAYVNFEGGEPGLREALVWMEKARDRQPDFPFYSNSIARVRFFLGDAAGAEAAFEDALELQPWNVQALRGMYGLADATGNEELREDARQRLCTLGADFCP